MTLPVTLTVQTAMTMNCAPQAGPGTLGSNYTATCTASGGTPPYNWTVSSGRLPDGVTLSPSGATATISGVPRTAGSFTYTVTVTDSSTPVQSANQPYSGTVAAPPTAAILTVSPTGLNFTYRRDDAAPPVPQSVSVFSNVAGTAFTASATTSTGGSWLGVSPASGQTAESVSVSVTANTLGAGTYSGQVTINAPSASPSSVTVPVSLTVVEVPPALLSVSPPVVTYATVQGGAATQQQVVISNAGGGTLNFGVQVAGGSWLTAGATSGRVAPGNPALLPVTLNPQGLSAGTYRGSIVVRTSDGQQFSTVMVTLTVSPLTQSIVLTQTGLQFTAVSSGTAPPAQSFVVENGGLGTMSWTAVAQSVSGGNWLSVAPASGSAAAGSTNTPVGVSVNPGSLAAGTYYGLVRVASPGAGNSPQLVSVVLNVLAPGDLPAPTISSVGLLPVGLVGGSPATDTTTLYNLTNQPQTFTSVVSTQDGGTWLSVRPMSGTVPAAGSMQLTVQANASGLSAGVRYGLVRLAFPDGTVRTLRVVSVLGPAAGSRAEARAPEPTAGCTPASLALSLPSLELGFNVTASQAVPMQAKIVDNCGAAVTSGASVSMTFSNKDAPVTMIAGAGLWGSTWTPRNPGANIDVLVTAFLVVGPNVIGGQAKVTGTVRSAASTSAASPSVIANSASYLEPGQISPGSWVSIFGERMADGTVLASTVPFPNALNGTQAALGDIALPVMYVSATQVNALIPYSLSASANHPLLIQRNGTSSVPLDVTVADVLPAIYTANQSGSGQGAVLLASLGLLAAPIGAFPGSRPVRRGDFVEIYASGLGPVENTPPDGAAAPASEPLARIKLTATITIGGAPVTNVAYAGLAPGLVGLYQINVQVPDGAATGDAVPVVVNVGGNASNMVTIAVQ
jgi:uncharacterized protein (TIGR03437 family)